MPKIFGIKYKGTDEVHARRDAKISAVNMLWDLAVEDPIAAIDDAGNNYAAQAVALEYFQTLNPNSRQVLSTGKGCGTCPTEISKKGDFRGLTLWDFLEWGGSPYHRASNLYKGPVCFASFVHGGYIWSLHVIENNRASFPKRTVKAMKARLRDAYERKSEEQKLRGLEAQCPFCKNVMKDCSCE